MYTVLSCLGVFTFCTCCILIFLLCIVVVVLCVLLSSYVYLLYCMCVLLFFLNLDAGLLARSQYSKGPATGHLDTGFSRFPCVYKQTLRRFPTFQVATTCFSWLPTSFACFPLTSPPGRHSVPSSFSWSLAPCTSTSVFVATVSLCMDFQQCRDLDVDGRIILG